MTARRLFQVIEQEMPSGCALIYLHDRRQVFVPQGIAPADLHAGLTALREHLDAEAESGDKAVRP